MSSGEPQFVVAEVKPAEEPVASAEFSWKRVTVTLTFLAVFGLSCYWFFAHGELQTDKGWEFMGDFLLTAGLLAGGFMTTDYFTKKK